MALERLKLVKVTRFFSAKISLGAQSYESRTFSCFAEAECDPQERQEVSRELFRFCQAEVYESIREYKAKERARFKKLMAE